MDLIEVPAGGEAAFLAPLPISKLWGVGPKTAARLEALGLHTIGELMQAPPAKLKATFGLWALELQNRARGLDTSSVETDRETNPSAVETTFVKDVGDPERLKHVLLELCEQVGQDLRAEELQARTVAIKLRWPSFQTSHVR